MVKGRLVYEEVFQLPTSIPLKWIKDYICINSDYCLHLVRLDKLSVVLFLYTVEKIVFMKKTHTRLPTSK